MIIKKYKNNEITYYNEYNEWDSKNDLPSHIEIFNPIFVWCKQNKTYRTNDLFTYLLYGRNKYYKYELFDQFYKYNGYSIYTYITYISDINKYYKFIKGICFERLHEELLNDD